MLPSTPALNRKRYAQQKQTSSYGSATEAAQDEFSAFPLDSVSAFEAIVRQVSTTSGFPLVIPACFIHQVHVIIKDKTVVSRELQEARNRGELRQMCVETCGILLVREVDYNNLLEALIGRAELDPSAEFEVKVLKQFLIVLKSHFDLGISQKKLVEKMGMEEQQREACKVLLRLGFLVYQTHGPDVEYETAFWFTLPNMSALINDIEAGRKEIVSLIKKAKPHRQLLLSKLLSKVRMRNSSLSIEYLVKDVIGCGLIVARDTALEGKASLLILPDKLTNG